MTDEVCFLLKISQTLCLLFAVWMTAVIYSRVNRDMDVEGSSFALFALGWTGFVAFRWIFGC